VKVYAVGGGLLAPPRLTLEILGQTSKASHELFCVGGFTLIFRRSQPVHESGSSAPPDSSL
jgi:hypothetical protein